MSLLTNNLKSDHEKIIGMLREVTKLGICSIAGQQKLIQAKLLLLSHLEREDKELYPILAKEAIKMMN